MSAAVDRYVAEVNAVAAILREHQTVATGLGEWACKCSPMQWRSLAHRSMHVAEAVVSSGVVRVTVNEEESA